MIYLIWIPFLVLLAVYCWFEKLEKFWTATTLKVVLSGDVAATAVYAAIKLGSLPTSLFAIGLLCAVPADYFLQYIKSDLKRYRWGILFFGAMHICLLVSFYMVSKFMWYELAILVFFLLILAFFQKIEHWKMGKEKWQLTAYTLLVTLMAAKTISMGITNPSESTIFLAIGGLCFFASDLFLGIWDYYKDKFAYLTLNRVIYFAGQLCLAFYLLTML